MKAILAGLLALVACGHHTTPLSVDGATNGDTAAALDAPGDAPVCAENLLVAAHPDVALAPAPIVLEGAFVQSATFNFDGAPNVSAQSLGAQRATIAVPPNARSGMLSAECGVPAPLPFQRTTFPLALGDFATSYEQPGGAARAPAVFFARAGHTAVVAGNSVYVIGGASDANGWDPSVERAVINADGTLGVFSVVSGITLTVPRVAATATRIGMYVYVVGGSVDTAYHDSVERAPIHADGSLGPFTIVNSTHLIRGRANHTAEVIGSYLYVFGGMGSSQTPPGEVVGTVERAPIGPDGSLGMFAQVGMLSTPRLGHTSAVIGDHVYITGGGNFGTSPLRDVEAATIDASGNLTAFSSVGQLVVGRGAPQSIVIGNAWYVMGGSGGTAGVLSSIERADIQSDGSLAAFAVMSTGELALPREQFALVHAGNYVYAISGLSTEGGQLPASCDRASIQRDGSLGSFSAGSDLGGARAGHGTVALGNHLYVLGGFDGATTAAPEVADVAPDGSLGAFGPASSQLVQARAGFSLAVAWSYVYVIGGRTATGLTGSIERSASDTAGSLPAFSAVAVAQLNVAREQHTSLVIGNKLVVLGGKDANGPLDSLEQATINPGGSLAPFNVVTTTALGTPRYGHATVRLGNHVYVVGGTNAAGNALASIEVATVAADGTLGSFSPAGNLTAPRTHHTLAVIGDKLYVIGGARAGGPVAEVERASIDHTGTLGSFGVVSGVALQTARRDASTAVAGNYAYVIGGQTASGASKAVEQALLQ